ncbi:MAG: ComEC/Rec2 family competence protein [Pseudomonadota bacterium]
MAPVEDNPSGARAGPGLPELRPGLRAAWARLAQAERRRSACWAPALAGLGIWLYFALPVEPTDWTLAVAMALAAAAIPVFAALRPPLSALWAALALVAAGFAAAAGSARMAAAPVLAEPMAATVEGRVAELSRSATDRRRAELDELVIYGLAPDETPARVRVTLLEGAFARGVRPGERIRVFARLSPPGGPVEPGGFDFRRHAWFERLGGVGYALGPVVAAPEMAGGSGGIGAWLDRARGRMTAGILEALPGREGAFAAAILTGSREAVRAPELQALRDSNLAHLLAISGLHMGLLAALVFAAARLALAAAPGAAVRLPAKKVAAGAALAAAAAYLALSGASVATQRAFVMAAVALGAVLIDRPAVSMRALAAAALIVLAIRPESLLGAGFQMSFAAAAALVAVYEGVRDRGWLRPGPGGWGRRVAVWAAALALTSLVAGLATAPYAAAAFNRAANYGLLANLLAAPVMAFWVAPMGALTGLLAPLGLHWAPLQAMGVGISAILEIAEWTAGLPGAVRTVAQPPAGAVGLITLGGLWLAIWRTRLRLAGLAPLALGVAVWAQGAARPEVLIAPEARVMGALGPEGRAADRARGAGYAVESWLAHDGDPADQRAAAARPGLERGEGWSAALLSNGWRVVRLHGRDADARRLCAPRTVLVAWEAAGPRAGPCLLLDRARLSELGAVAISARAGAGRERGGEAAQARLRIRGALPPAAGRLWAGAGHADADDE